MEFVDLMYKYVNRFINCESLLKDLENLDLSKYPKEEVECINKLILDLRNINENIPNEVDEIEKNRISNINNILELLRPNLSNNEMDEEAKKLINERYNALLKEKEIVKDGGKLYTEIFTLMTNHPLVNKYASQMDDKELLNFITRYIYVPLPPQINQDTFNGLVKAGIQEDKREALWRLAFNYEHKKIDFSLIEDYFIEKRDDYYLVELISAVQEDLDMNGLIEKVMASTDKVFIHKVGKRIKKLGLLTDEELAQIKEKYEI